MTATAHRFRRGALILPILIGVAPLFNAAYGQDPQAAAPNPEALKAAMAAGKPAGEAEKPKRFPEFSEVTKDMETVEGLFTLYRYPATDKERDTEKLLCKIPRSLIGQDMLFATSISRGGYFTGWMWTDYLVRWEIADRFLKLTTPDTRWVQKQGQPVTDVVKRTYNESFIAAVPIVTMSPGGDPVIDLTPLLKSDIADISFMAGGASVRPELSTWSKIKNFPENILIDVDLALTSRRSEGQSIGVSYAFRKLPDLSNYTPRVADDRIGYFLTARADWSKRAEERETFDRYVNRWKLEKRDSSLDLSPPKQPITFILEKTIPIQWRRWVRAGVLEWNKAYEKVGFIDAIVVQQQTDDNEFAEYDPEDARYNFIRWIVSGQAFAMGPSRTDPRTGQILDADIIVDDSFIRAWMQDFDLFSPSVAANAKGDAFKEWRLLHPDLVPSMFNPRSDQQYLNVDNIREQLMNVAREKLHANGHSLCTHAVGMQQQLSLLRNAMIATGSGKKFPEHFIGGAIRELVAHEVGHTLGLRHNFKGSAWLTLEDAKNRRDKTDDAFTASVMDYNPLMFFAGDTVDSVRHIASPTIGPYDYWAIEYGYRVPAQGETEEKVLKDIAGRCTQPELAYATDEDTMWIMSPDPLSNRYDFSADPLTWARSRFELCDKLMKDIATWSLKDDEPRYFLRAAFDSVWFERTRNLEYVGRLIGGQYFNRDRRGDANARPAFVIVEPDLQRKALKLLSETLFNDQFFQVDQELLNQLAPSRWSHWGMPMSARLDYPIHDRILMMQAWTLMDIVNPITLQRIYDAELKSNKPDRFTAAEAITGVRDAIWVKLAEPLSTEYGDAKPYLSSITRGLQREYLDMMLAYVRTSPGSAISSDLHGMLSYAMRELSTQIGATLDKGKTSDGKSKLDFASRAHLVECKSRIDRTLEAQFQAR